MINNNYVINSNRIYWKFEFFIKPYIYQHPNTKYDFYLLQDPQLMIRDYKKVQLVKKTSLNCSLYKVQKNGEPFFMYEFAEINQCDEYSFKVIKKLVTPKHVTKIHEKFTESDKTYFVTDYFPSDLLKQQLKQPNQIFQPLKALQIFAKMVQLIEEVHQNKIIYRNLRLQMIAFKNNELYFTDFAFAQFVKRKERYFQVVGVTKYLAPEFYMEDGYGFEVDIWSAGVCLYYMLTGSFPFNCDNKSSEGILQEIGSKCKKGFDFEKNAASTKKAKLIQTNKSLQDLFKRIFQVNYNERITLTGLKQHPSLKNFFGIESIVKESYELSVIQEQRITGHESIFVSALKSFPCHFQFHKEEIILDFLQRSSEVLMLESPDIISEKIRTLVNFSVLKIAVLKVNNLMAVLLGKKEPQFKIEPEEWQEMKKTGGFLKVKQKIQKKKKILQMLFKAACLNVKKFKQQSNYYSDEIPSDFSLMKHEYRQNLSAMFEIEKQILKRKQIKQKMRRTCENLARLTILCLINRVFKEPSVKENFQLYFKWSKKQSLQSLQEWIQTERLSNLKAFIIGITSKYMD